MNQKEGDCFKQFRTNNCNLQNPSGETCTRLHRCIVRGSSLDSEQVGNSSQKIDRLEEGLENILLLLGGAGVAASLKQITRIPRVFSKLAGAVI